MNIQVTTNEMLLLGALFFQLLTIWITTAEYDDADDEYDVAPLFHSESFNELKKGHVYRWGGRKK